ncbi:MAG TPA: helix-turn-helix transcriptional regulator [Polyangia bacterium]|nr:helix-turn-helix transcriptional regulator [Polyangia bacterium]
MTGDELRELRARNNMTAAELADVLGVSEDHVLRMEAGKNKISARSETRLSEWDENGQQAPVTGGTAAFPAASVLPPDELPEPDGNPSDQPLDDEPEPATKRTRKPRVQGPRALAGWQAQAQTFLADMMRGQAINVALPDGGEHQIVIPGLAHAVQALWCPQCAVILANAADPWAAAFVKAYPATARRLLVPGPQAELVIVTITQIAIPCVTHHIHLGHGASENGAAAARQPYEGEVASQ